MSHCKEKIGCEVVEFPNAKQFDSHSRQMRPLGRASVVAMVLFSGIAFGQEKPVEKAVSTGTIRGKVTYVTDPKRPWRLGRYYIRNAQTGELAEAVVAITVRGPKATDQVREAETLVVDQKDFQFTPETVAIRAGDRVRFLNSDDHTHNVKTSHPEHSFNVTMPVGSEHIETFKTATGIKQPFLIDCVFHSAMRSWIFVFDHPWFQVTGKDGSFSLGNVPPGEYRLEVVHPAGGLRARQLIQVVAGKAVDVDVKLMPVGETP